MAQESESTGGKIQFGNISNNANLAGLFGGNKTFNMGAGSSSFDITTNSVDLSSMFRDESTNTTRKEVSGGGFDAALSLGLGLGGGSGSGGQVEKVTSTNTTDNSQLSAGNKANGNTPLYIALGVVGLGAILIIMKRKK